MAHPIAHIHVEMVSYKDLKHVKMGLMMALDAKKDVKMWKLDFHARIIMQDRFLSANQSVEMEFE